MTREEREYFVQELKQMFAEWAGQFVPDAEEKYAAFVKTFEDKYMQKLSGQNPFPQDLFRVFLQQTGAALTPDDELSYVSDNSVQNKVLAKEFDKKSDIGHTHTQISNGSTVISTTDKKAVITAPATDIQDTNGMPIIQTRQNDTVGSEIGSLVLIGDKRNTAGKRSDLILNGDSIGDGMKLINQRVYSFDLDLTTEEVQDKKWLPNDFAFPISMMFSQYLNTGDYPDGLNEAQDLMAISGAQIHPTLKGKFWKDSQQKVAHFQHFKPWTIHFYDAIQQYDSIQYTESTPVLEIEVGNDTTKYMEQINGLSDVKYLRLNNSSSTTIEWLFINSSNEQVGSFTIQ